VNPFTENDLDEPMPFEKPQDFDEASEAK